MGGVDDDIGQCGLRFLNTIMFIRLWLFENLFYLKKTDINSDQFLAGVWMIQSSLVVVCNLKTNSTIQGQYKSVKSKSSQTLFFRGFCKWPIAM